jgi:23S rRNA (uracil1939-C5)-methyltransferase
MARFFKPTKKSTVTTKHLEFEIKRLDHHGAGIAFHKNKPVFIEGALPGEKVVAQFTENKNKFAKAKLIKTLVASDERVTPFCPHYHECGGCNQQHLARESQLNFKQQALSQMMEKFASQSIQLDDTIAGNDLGYRRRARLSVFLNKKVGRLQVGFRKKQSKQIVDIQHCPVLDERLNNLIPGLTTLLSCFQDQGALGHVELVQASNTSVMVLRHVRPLCEEDRKALEGFAKQHQATLYLMPESNRLDRQFGDEPYYDEIGVQLPFLPSHFIQVNAQVNQQMVDQAMIWLEPKDDERILDLFCGLGNFTLPIAKKAAHVTGVEGVQDMVDWARENAKVNKIANADFYQADLDKSLAKSEWASEKFDKILLDPARAGATGVIDQVSELGAQRVLYVSCNPATLARDSNSLIQQGYKLTKLAMMDMFPHTSHLESMALFERVG